MAKGKNIRRKRNQSESSESEVELESNPGPSSRQQAKRRRRCPARYKTSKYSTDSSGNESDTVCGKCNLREPQNMDKMW